MKKTFRLTLAALALLPLAEACSSDEPNEPVIDPVELSVDPATISASGGGGSLTFNISSNANWMVTETAEWISLEPVAGSNNGTVTVTILKNLSGAERTTTITITAENLTQTVALTQQALETPPYAVSDKTWVIGGKTWSDFIHVPACNTNEWVDDSFLPQCRTHDVRGTLYYYYNWAYTDENLNLLCPSPWRMPTADEFIALDIALGGDGQTRVVAAEWVSTNYLNNWGGQLAGYSYGGYLFFAGEGGYCWSSTPDSDPYYYDYAYHNTYGVTGGVGIVRPATSALRSGGFPVRCIK